MNNIKKSLFCLFVHALCFMGVSVAAPAGVVSPTPLGAFPEGEWTDNGQWNRVFLATYPRSGNHWTRYLLEEVTGVATGCVFRDGHPTHLADAFDWGGYAPQCGYTGKSRLPKQGDAVILKTHYPASYVRHSIFDRQGTQQPTLVITRFPFDAMYSYFDHFSSRSRRNWDKFIHEEAEVWARYHDYWEAQPNIMVVRYEDLMEDAASVLKKICEFYGIEASQEDFERAQKAHPSQGTIGKHLSRYSQKQIDYVLKTCGDKLERYGYLEYLGKKA